jgi:two-component system, OmpR family, sensor histidine kinase VicK
MASIEIIGGGVVGAIVVGGTVGWFVMKRTKRKDSKATTKLASSLHDEKLKSDIILNSIEDGVVFIDDKGTIQLFNPGAAAITGWSQEEAQGLDWKSVFNFINTKGEPIISTETPFGRALGSGQTVRDNTANISSKSNMSIAADFSVSPIITDAVVSGMVCIFRDVSKERAEESQRAEFISTASHEMRTPVAAIEGYLSLALNDKVATIDARAKDYLQKAHASTKHLGELFQDLLNSAKAEDGRLTNHPEVVEMGEFMEALTNDLHFAAQKKNLGVDFMIGNNSIIDATNIDASVPVKFGGGERVVRPLYNTFIDPDRMREVVTNLFDNACKYSEKGKISLGLTGNDKVVQIYIRDTGHGIPPEDIPHLFQKFYRVDNSATRTIGGTGLGLFICRKIVELYHGRIWVESTLGEGSTFYINLPRLSSQEAEKMREERSAANGPQEVAAVAAAGPAAAAVAAVASPAVPAATVTPSVPPTATA